MIYLVYMLIILLLLVIFFSYFVVFAIKNKKLSIIFILLGVLTVIFLKTKYNKINHNERFDIVSSNGMIGTIVNELCSDIVSSKYIVPLGAEVHEYEISKKEKDIILNSTMYFINGLGLESSKSMQNAINSHNNVVNLGEYCFSKAKKGLIYHEDGTVDPHIWMDLTMVMLWVDKICEEIIVAFPEARYEVLLRKEKILKRMMNCDSEVRLNIKSLPKDFRLITTHRGFYYFAREYINCNFMEYCDAPEGVSQFIEPTLRDMHRVENFIIRTNSMLIFRELGMQEKYIKEIQESLRKQNYYVWLSKGFLQSDSAHSEDDSKSTAPERMILRNSSVMLEEYRRLESPSEFDV